MVRVGGGGQAKEAANYLQLLPDDSNPRER